MVETGGRLGADALRLLSELGDVTAASNSRISKLAFVRCALAQLADSLCHDNAGVYAGSMSRLLRVAGSAVQVGETGAMECRVSYRIEHAERLRIPKLSTIHDGRHTHAMEE